METIVIGGKDVQIKQFELQTREIIKEYVDVLKGLASWKSKSRLVRKYLRQKDSAIKKINAFYHEQVEELSEFLVNGAIEKDAHDEKMRELLEAQVSLVEKVKSNIPNDFFYESTWKLIVHRGFWPFRKPFRSYRQMIKQSEVMELANCIKFIGDKVLGYKTNIDELDGQKKTAN
jgi:hypothetical protein